MQNVEKSITFIICTENIKNSTCPDCNNKLKYIGECGECLDFLEYYNGLGLCCKSNKKKNKDNPGCKNFN